MANSSFTVHDTETQQPRRIKLIDQGDGTFAEAEVEAVPSSLADGQKVVTTAGTRVQLTTTATPARRVTIQALEGNVGRIVVGGATVVAALATRRGIAISTEDAFDLEIDDLSKVWLDATVSGDGVSYAVTS